MARMQQDLSRTESSKGHSCRRLVRPPQTAKS